MQQPDEGLIHQWLDGECTPAEAAEIERLVASDPAWAAAVAEARGLIAASSRIVGALDAVPHARPQGSVAAQSARHSGVRVRPWMRFAAALVLVAGTAYVLRERAREPFAPPVAQEPAPQAADRVAEQGPTSAVASSAVSAVEPDATPAPAPTPARPAEPAAARVTASAPVPAPPPAVLSASDSVAIAARRAEFERRLSDPSARAALSEVVVTGVAAQKTPEKAANAMAAAAPTPAARETLSLDGCWTILAPSEMIALLVGPKYWTVTGDSLVLIVKQREYPVRRDGDRLSGALAARRISCPEP